MKAVLKRRSTSSLIAGVLIPVVYGVILIPIGLLLQSYYPDPESFAKKFRIATLPIFFPVWLSDYLGLRLSFAGDSSVAIIFGTDVLIYAFLVYCVLYVRSRRRQQKSS